MKKITLKPIGVIHTPYKISDKIPIQGVFDDNVESWLELNEEYVPGLRDLSAFSHAILLYFFHLSIKEHIQGKPYLEDIVHGIFAIRSPHRPNHLGMSIVKIKRIVETKLYFNRVDMIDGTPLIDIKPYVKYFDCQENAISGWLDKHYATGSFLNTVYSK